MNITEENVVKEEIEIEGRLGEVYTEAYESLVILCDDEKSPAKNMLAVTDFNIDYHSRIVEDPIMFLYIPHYFPIALIGHIDFVGKVDWVAYASQGQVPVFDDIQSDIIVKNGANDVVAAIESCDKEMLSMALLVVFMLMNNKKITVASDAAGDLYGQIRAKELGSWEDDYDHEC